MELENYLPDLEEEIGEITEIEDWAPGVYHLITADSDPETHLWVEYIAVLDAAPMAEKVRRYGKELDGLRLYAMADDASGWRVVQYEVSKYSISVKKKPVPEWMFRDMSLHAMELHPEYFGAFPVPFHTPFGYTLRYRVLDNGIYWLETSQCRELLAVCSPIWEAELSEAARRCGRVLDCDRRTGGEKETPYRFFTKEASCIALYELMETRRRWDGTVICRPALMNAIWKHVPSYAMHLNGQMPPGKLSTLLTLREGRAMPLMPGPDGKHIIGMYPDAGTDFLLLE